MQYRDDPEPSYDPRSWSRPRPAPVAAPPMPATPHADPSRNRMPLIAALAVAIGGAIIAYTARPANDRPAALAPTPTAAAGTPYDQRVLNIATPDAIAPTLRALGVAKDDATRAAELAQAALADSSTRDAFCWVT